MKSKISASLPFNKQIVSNPRCLSELKKFNFICSPLTVVVPPPPLDVVGLVIVTDSFELTSIVLEPFEAFLSLLRRSSAVGAHGALGTPTLEKLLFVIDWLEVDEVAVDDEVHVEPGDDQDLIARQCITGLTSRQNSG